MSGILRPPCRDCGRLYGHLDNCRVPVIHAELDKLIARGGIDGAILQIIWPIPEVNDLAHKIALRSSIEWIRSEATILIDGENNLEWWDISVIGGDIDSELRYLELRGLIIKHPTKPNWVRGKESE